MIYFNELEQLEGKTIDRIDRDEHDQFVVIYFKDGTIWLATARRSNCCGVKVDHMVGKNLKRQNHD